MLDLVIFLEADVCVEDFDRNDKMMGGRAERPDVGSEDHDAEGNVGAAMCSCHMIFECSGKILAQACVYSRRHSN